MHIKIPNSRQFSVDHNHGHLYVPEQLVVSEDDYRHSLEENEDPEVQEAKRWKMSLEEFRMQRNWLEESAKKKKDSDAMGEGTFYMFPFILNSIL